ncbi:hypothetical protein [Actinomadura monticuli]|uniref:Uncharacterized protein n=1 Tax=Actinomadura monticuli TaxID=3097367 RepID=A0ABV4QFA6_9ACTN
MSALEPAGRPRPVDAVEPPSPSAGEAREILAGPKGTFVVVAFRKGPCESRFYRFRLTGDGRVEGMEPLRREPVPAPVAGLAISPDGDRLAYTTAPCASGARRAAEPRATVTVSDLGSGRRRTWSTAAPSVIGEIAWAGDGRTLGYAVSDVRPDDSSGSGVPPGQMYAPIGRGLGSVTVHALDTRARGTDLRAGRVLFRGPADSGSVTTAVMNPDGRTGYGVMRTTRPPSTVLFSFSEGEPMRVTTTIPQKPNTLMAIAFMNDDGPRHACLNGLDAFGRVIDGGFLGNSDGAASCGPAYAY